MQLQKCYFPKQNLLILTAGEKRPLMGSQDTHVIELIPIPKLHEI